MTFYRQKSWWKSKTVWTGIVGAVIGVLVLFGVPVPVDMTETLVGAIMVVIGVLTTIFRGNADTNVVLTEKT